VAELSSPPSPLTFYRDYVSANLPVLIRGAVDEWPALERWRSNDYLRRAMGDQLVSVACTPHGRADSVQDGVLMLPCEERWAFGRFVDYIERQRGGGGCGDGAEVCYLQAQNASFSSEYQPLHDDVGPLEWATVAFNDAPDAVNFWMGNSHSLTALHQDAYENIYAVITGQKTFLLFPPTDLYWLDERTYSVGRYVRSTDGALQPSRDEQASEVPWVVDVEQQLREMEREYKQREEQQQQEEEGENEGEDEDEEGEERVDEAESIGSNNDGSGDDERAPDEPSITEEMRRKFGKSVQPLTLQHSTALHRTAPHRTTSPHNHHSTPHYATNEHSRVQRADMRPSACSISPRVVVVRAGEVLYLPCLWFHCVAQSDDDEGKCIAVNMWSAARPTQPP